MYITVSDARTSKWWSGQAAAGEEGGGLSRYPFIVAADRPMCRCGRCINYPDRDLVSFGR